MHYRSQFRARREKCDMRLSSSTICSLVRHLLLSLQYDAHPDRPPAWGALPDYVITPEDTAMLDYGPAIAGAEPRALVQTNRALITNVYQAEQVFNWLTMDDIVLTTVPFFRLETFSFINFAIHKG